MDVCNLLNVYLELVGLEGGCVVDDVLCLLPVANLKLFFFVFMFVPDISQESVNLFDFGKYNAPVVLPKAGR